MSIEAALSRACERVPGLVRGALVLLPDGFLLAGLGVDRMHELEPLIRSAGRCLVERESPAKTGEFVEYLFVIHDELVVIQRGRRDPRIALAVVCTREHNVGFALSAARLAMRELDQTVDLATWGL